MTRTDIAERLTCGLGGWFQVLAAQNLHEQAGEESARVMALQILNAQNAYRPQTSQKPVNWGATKKRVDIALLGTSAGAAGWYGAFELKWAAVESDPRQIRQSIVQDVTRLAFTRTTNMCANILLLGGTSNAIGKLFNTPHPDAVDREGRRVSFNKLLSRQSANSDGQLLPGELQSHFPSFGERVPPETFADWDGRLKASLLSTCDVRMGGRLVGTVFAWQCKRTRGTAN
jgi:hypothetical protein